MENTHCIGDFVTYLKTCADSFSYTSVGFRWLTYLVKCVKKTQYITYVVCRLSYSQSPWGSECCSADFKVNLHSSCCLYRFLHSTHRTGWQPQRCHAAARPTTVPCTSHLWDKQMRAVTFVKLHLYSLTALSTLSDSKQLWTVVLRSVDVLLQLSDF